MSITIIAEAGLNHNGDVNKALKLVDAAKEAGADIVKFQTFVSDLLLRRGDPSEHVLRDLALPFNCFATIARHCERTGIEFCSTPGDLPSLRFLVEECGVKRIKVGSDDLTNRALVGSAYATDLPVILSTGMATMQEIAEALPTPWTERDVTLLHCVSLYPCPPQKANLLAISVMHEFGLPVGYSDHVEGVGACLVAAALGAVVIEKHIMLDVDGEMPVDGAVSIEPEDFGWVVGRIREIEAMLGHGRKEPWPEEVEAARKLRKGADGFRGEAA